jgi:hypothetical protein
MTSPVDEDGTILADVTDLTAIVDHIDTTEGRNDALRAYIYALRDLQRAHVAYSVYGEATEAELYRANTNVVEAFERLIDAQFSLSDELPTCARRANK